MPYTLTPDEELIQEWLEKISALYNGNRHGGPMEAMLKHGRIFKPGETARPKGMRKMRNRACFENAFLTSYFNDAYTYVEGWAVSQFFPVHHAWVIDSKGEVVDPTWKAVGDAYVGIPFNAEFVGRTIHDRGLFGVLEGIDYSKPIPRSAIALGHGRKLPRSKPAE